MDYIYAIVYVINRMDIITTNINLYIYIYIHGIFYKTLPISTINIHRSVITDYV